MIYNILNIYCKVGFVVIHLYHNIIKNKMKIELFSSEIHPIATEHNSKILDRSQYVYMIDEENDPLSGYYDFYSSCWRDLNDNKIESIDFKWFYKPEFINY